MALSHSGTELAKLAGKIDSDGLQELFSRIRKVKVKLINQLEIV
jgi:hypothetical protein